MIKYKTTVGEVTTELECQTIGELIEYLNYDKEDQEESRVVVEAGKMNNDWIEWTWTEEKPYPETLDTLVYIKDATGYDEERLGHDSSTVEFWYRGDSSWKPSEEDGEVITHYKLA